MSNQIHKIMGYGAPVEDREALETDQGGGRPAHLRTIEAGNGEVYTVELVDTNIWQSVFPTAEAEKSALHDSPEDAWDYINSVRMKPS